MDNDNYRIEDIRKACTAATMREKLYKEKLKPFVEELQKMFGIIPENPERH